MANNPHEKLAALKAQVAALEAKLSRENRKLAVLPAKYGFKSMDAFITALRAASGGTASNSASTPSGRKPRAKITPETKAKVKELVKADKTGSEIAKALNISLPSVQNIKKELGLVKARKK
jgi:DNA invertase Pin-like site-specific DNA recombinase